MKITFAQIEQVIIREDISHRGGGVEISLSNFGKKYNDHKMTAYQNYLGGGMLGRVCNSCSIENWKTDAKLATIGKKLREYLHSLTNADENCFENLTFEQNQKAPIGY